MALLCAASLVGVSAQRPASWPPSVRKTPEKAPVLSAEEEMKTMVLPPGYRVELVAKEPLVIDPIAIDFDADGRMWVLEMPGFMSEPGGANSREPINNVVVLEDENNDGVMDKRTVFAEKLVLPRALKVLDAGALVGEPPNLWLMKDTNGNLKADSKELVSDSYGRAAASIEHNANSLHWGLDNIIYTSEHTWHLIYRNGKFETMPALQRGQWGASMDDAGRIYRNVNDAPLFVDFIAARYYARNPNMVRTRGLYDPLISREASTIWPVRATRGVNRGYRDQFFRPDGSSVTIQGVGTPVVYRGDRLPKELYGDAFITDSTTNLVHRYRIQDDGTGQLKAVDGYAKGEILALWDERFRPVNMLGAPDGTLYVVDMYRGIVQEQIYWTDFLRDYIKAGDLERPVGLGRIWRITHETTKRDQKPALSKAPAAALVKTLSHPNGWWRDTAQRLLVERGDKSAVPQLAQLAQQTTDWRVKLHALWTLDGLDAIEAQTVQRALADKSPEVRAAAVRLSERWLSQANHPLAAAVLKLADDATWTVRRQVAATIGELPPPARLDPAVSMLMRYGSDPITVDVTISSLRGAETAALTRLLDAPNTPTDAIATLTGAVARSGDVAAVQQCSRTRNDGNSRPVAVRLALLQGLDTGLPGGGGGRGGRGRRARRWARRRAWRCRDRQPRGSLGRALNAGRGFHVGRRYRRARKTDSGEARVAEQAGTRRRGGPAQRRRGEAVLSRRRNLQEPVRRVPSTGRTREGKDGAIAGRIAVCDWTRRRRFDSHPARRKGRPRRPDAAARRRTQRRSDRGGADLRAAQVGKHRFAGGLGRHDGDSRVDEDAGQAVDRRGADASRARARRTRAVESAVVRTPNSQPPTSNAVQNR